MLVTNNTAHCYVLSAGVIIRPNDVDVSVADALYTADSTLNRQLDALDVGGEITITDKPTDPFPEAALLVSEPGSSGDLMLVTDGDGNIVFTIHQDGLIETNDAGLSINHNGGMDAGYLILQPSNAAYDILSVQGKPGQTGKLLLVKDGNGATVFRVDANGTVHIKTGGTIQADL